MIFTFYSTMGYSSLIPGIVFEIQKSGCHIRSSQNIGVGIRKWEYHFQKQFEPKLWNLWMYLAKGDSRGCIGQIYIISDKFKILSRR